MVPDHGKKNCRRPRAIVAHPIWGRGGAEAAAMWVLVALVEDFDVTVYTAGGFDLAALNELAGTDLQEGRIVLSRWVSKPLLPIGALSAGAFLRSLWKVGRDYDLRVSAATPLPWGRPAVHFISSVLWNDRLAAKASRVQPLDVSIRTRLSQCLIKLCSGWKARISPADVLIANSQWTRRQCIELSSKPIHVVHPVVPSLPPGRSWNHREQAVLVFGRVSPEKRVESCIRIVEMARSWGFPGHLVIAGPAGEARYVDEIETLCRARSDWITRVPGLFGADKLDLLGRVKYGLSACSVEAFGIATAEMAASGIVVIVPEGTGQSDIIVDPIQTYRTEVEAASHLLTLARDGTQQIRLHKSAYAGAGRYSSARFINQVRAIFGDALNQSAKST